MVSLMTSSGRIRNPIIPWSIVLIAGLSAIIECPEARAFSAGTSLTRAAGHVDFKPLLTGPSVSFAASIDASNVNGSAAGAVEVQRLQLPAAHPAGARRNSAAGCLRSLRLADERFASWVARVNRNIDRLTRETEYTLQILGTRKGEAQSAPSSRFLLTPLAIEMRRLDPVRAWPLDPSLSSVLNWKPNDRSPLALSLEAGYPSNPSGGAGSALPGVQALLSATAAGFVAMILLVPFICARISLVCARRSPPGRGKGRRDFAITGRRAALA